jgi:hypothetical protein
MTTISTLRPGLLVSLKTSVSGNAIYRRRDLENTTTDEGAARARWETERTIVDPVEHDTATKVRTKARVLITAVCANSNFGLLCPESASEELNAAIAGARTLIAEFNLTAKCTRIRLYVVAGRVAPNDVEAVRAINSELSEMLQDMENGVSNLDVKAIRESANRAKGIAEMLSTEARVQAEIAIDAARRAARAIVKADGTAVQVDKRAVRAIAEARTIFLDMDDATEIAAPAAQGVALDLDVQRASDEYVADQQAQAARAGRGETV